MRRILRKYLKSGNNRNPMYTTLHSRRQLKRKKIRPIKKQERVVGIEGGTIQ